MRQTARQTTGQTTGQATRETSEIAPVNVNVELLQSRNTPTRISLLINSVYFFIESVFIMETARGYRLLAIHQGRLITDQTYKTPKGAKIAFLKFFGYKAWEEGVKTRWTPFYPPEQPWLDEKYRITEKKN